MLPNKRYSATLEKELHVSAAILDTSQLPANAKKNTQVFVNTADANGQFTVDNQFLIANLSKSESQFPLDIVFGKNEKMVFTQNGIGVVHLTGYVDTVDER